MANVDAQLAQLQGQLADLAKAMQLAAATPGQEQALAMFRDQFRKLSAQAAALRAQASASDRPGTFLTTLDELRDFVISTGQQVGAPVGDLFRSTGTLLKLLPWLVVAAVAGIFLLAYKGKLKGIL